ncbi:MAG: sugar phosphate isomerase/epimerase family protein [Thermodesulfobacteriota bacterium]
MKNWKFAVNSGFFGRRRDRFTEYQPDRSLEEKFELAKQIEGIEGIELKYPGDLKELTLAKQLLKESGLVCSAINVDIKDATYFRYGALSAQSKEARKRAISLLTEGMDIAAELGAGLVTTCPLADGYDYPFQIDYSGAWGRFIESVKDVVSYRKDVKLALEYQPHEPHAKIMLSNVGKALHVCSEVGLPNLGVNLDIGHSFAAGESPAESAALLADKNRLFYIHTNDNTGEGGDWDMISGTVHFWHWLEVLFTLDRVGYEGWLGGDITSKHIGPVEAFDTNTRMIQRMVTALERMGTEKIAELAKKDGSTAEVFKYLSEQLIPG